MGTMEMLPMFNNANNANGDLNINVASAVAGETFDFTVTLEKDSVVSGNGVGAWANAVNAYTTVRQTGF